VSLSFVGNREDILYTCGIWEYMFGVLVTTRELTWEHFDTVLLGESA